MKKDRFYEIDLLRFVAALSVMLYHYTFRGYAADNMNPLEFPYLASIFKYGSLGVDLFFIISGFVILLSAYNRDAISFAISRAARIYPAFWISVLLTSIVIYFFGGERYKITLFQFFSNFSMIHGYFGVKNVDGVYWSLLVELKFYFLIFLLIIFNQITKISIYLYLWLAVAYIGYFVPLTGAIGFFLFPNWAPYFVAGSFFFLIRINGSKANYLYAILLSYVLTILNASKGIHSSEVHYNTDFSMLVIGSVIGSFYIIFLLISFNVFKNFQKKYFLLLGSLTYPLYLIHQNIGFIYFNHFDGNQYKYINLAIMLCISLSIAYLINKYVERRYGKVFKNLLTSIYYSMSLRLRKLLPNEQ